MNDTITERLRQLDIELPEPSPPGGNYVPYYRCGDLLFLTGQLCHWNGERHYLGKLGSEFGLDAGQKAARMCGLNLLAQIHHALGGEMDRVSNVVRLAGYINSTADFHGQSQVMNGASDLFVEVFGNRGRHTRLAVGVNALPYNVAVEVEGIIEIAVD